MQVCGSWHEHAFTLSDKTTVLASLFSQPFEKKWRNSRVTQLVLRSGEDSVGGSSALRGSVEQNEGVSNFSSVCTAAGKYQRNTRPLTLDMSFCFHSCMHFLHLLR